MKKNMYSLMLSEDVVAEIDRLAAQEGSTRSGFINAVLAEYVSYRTPEMRVKEMFDRMEELLGQAGGMQVMLRSPGSLFNLRSMLSYKYNPAVNYSVELYRVMTDAVGEIRVSLRTQNSSLKLYIMQFYKLWTKIERSYLISSDYSIEAERFTKRLIIPRGFELSEEELCREISDYITAFDRALKAFFENLDDAQAAVSMVENIYRGYYSRCKAAL